LIEDISRHGITILLFLLTQERVVVSDARRLNIGYSTFYRSLIPLIRMGLIKEEGEGARKAFKLTELGRQVALKLKEVDDLLKTSVGRE
jgi:predicted transcriptional regulator